MQHELLYTEEAVKTEEGKRREMLNIQATNQVREFSNVIIGCINFVMQIIHLMKYSFNFICVSW